MESHGGLGGEDGCEVMPEYAPLQQADVEGDLLLPQNRVRNERQTCKCTARVPLADGFDSRNAHPTRRPEYNTHTHKHAAQDEVSDSTTKC